MRTLLRSLKRWHKRVAQAPEALSLGEMSYRITEHILKSETRHLTKAIDVLRHLMNLFLKGHQVPRLVRELESILSVRLHLLTPYLKPFTQAFYDTTLTKQLTTQLCTTDQTSFSICATRKSYMIFHVPTKYEQPFLLIAENLPLPLSNAHHFLFIQALHVLGFAFLQHELMTHQQYAVANNTLKEALEQPISPAQRTQYEQQWAITQHFICLYGKRTHEDGLPSAQLPMQLQHLLIETLKDSHISMQVFMIEDDTAKKLFIHRNTVLYRLNKCSTLLQKDLKDPEVTMQLRLALRIRKSFEANRVT